MINTPEYILFKHPIAGEIHWYPRTRNKLTWKDGDYVGENVGSDTEGFIVDLP